MIRFSFQNDRIDNLSINKTKNCCFKVWSFVHLSFVVKEIQMNIIMTKTASPSFSLILLYRMGKPVTSEKVHSTVQMKK